MKLRLATGIVLFLAAAAVGSAQEDTNELLQSPQVRRRIVLRVVEGGFEYQLDDGKAQQYQPLTSGQVFLPDGSVNLVLDDYNALTVTASADEKLEDDPSIKKLGEFLDKLIATAQAIEAKPQGKRLGAKCKTPRTAALIAWLSDADLLIRSQPDLQTRVEELEDAICAAEANAFKTIIPASDPPVWVANATTFEGLFIGSATTEAVLKQLITARDNLGKNIVDTKAELGTLEGLAKGFAKDHPTLGAFNLFASYVALNVKDEGLAVLARKEDLKKVVEGLIALVEKHKDKSRWSESSYQFKSVAIPRGKQNLVTITVKREGLDLRGQALERTAAATSTVTIKLRNFTRIVPEVAAGVAFTELDYPKYGTEEVDGKTVVVSAGNDHERVHAALFFDGVVRAWGPSVVYPMFQLGVGTGQDRPTILVGGGLRFTTPKNLAVSGGWIFSWAKDLDGLEVGDEVSGTAELEEHLKIQRGDSGAYFSVIYTFN